MSYALFSCRTSAVTGIYNARIPREVLDLLCVEKMAAEAAIAATAGEVITCNAAVAYEAGAPMIVDKICVAPPKPSEVRLKITHTSLCRTDLTFWRAIGQKKVFPRIFGHEAAGIVESVGKEVTGVKPGDHVVPLFTGECQECRYCRSGKTNLCQKFKVDTDRGVLASDGTSRFSTKDGKPIYHFLGTSTFSEYTVVDQACVAKIDKAAPLDKVCLLSCGMTTGLGASINTAKVEKGSTVAIFGLGTIGFAAAQGAKIAGASRIIGIDVLPEKLALGKKFGLTDTVNPKEHDKPIQEVIKEMTDGGVDYAIECVGNVKLIEAAVESVHEGWGKAVVAGLDDNTKFVSVHPGNFLYGRLLTGTFFGDYKGRSQMNDLVEMYMKKELNLDDFITHNLPFHKINEAFQLLIEGKCLRCVLHMEHDH
ncbi:alcohol dehydrogenase 1 [Selaginella moellendorffii]|nr:alcohol dehydrogenase 1 [Selaginella moellendorffii]|eukprot:XP_002968598.2 alcohol dehydrogenase 1 [Selaginella moellendorffii]